MHLLAALQALLILAGVAALLHEAFRPSPLLRWLLVAAGTLCVLAFAIPTLLRLRRRGSLRDFAAQVERRTGVFRAALVTAVELAERRAPAPERISTSRPSEEHPSRSVAEHPAWILSGLGRQVEKGIGAVGGVDLVDGLRLRRAGFIFLATLLGLGTAVAIHPRVFSEGFRRLLAPVVAVQAGRPTTATVPAVVRDVAVRMSPPAYTGWSERDLAAFSGTISVLRGTEITLEGRSALPGIVRLWVLLPGEDGAPERVPLQLRGGRFKLRHMVLRGGSFAFEARSADRTFKQLRPYLLEVRPDDPPSSRILFPAEDQEVHLDDEATLLFEVRDDFGVAAVRRVVRIVGAGMERTRRVGTPEGKKTFSGRDKVVFRDLGARPGDLLEIAYEAEDTDTLSGPKTTRSAPRRFKVFSAEERHARMLEREAELLEKMIVRLADRLELEPDVDGPDAARRTHTAYLGITRADAGYIRFFETLVRDLAEDTGTDELVRGALEDMLTRQRDLHRRDLSRVRALSPAQARNPWHVRRAMELHVRITDALETDVLALDELVIQQHEDNLARDAGDLQRMQEDLRELLASMRDGATDAQLRQALDAVDRLGERLRRMQKEMGRLSRKLPYENFNADALLRGRRNVSMGEMQRKLQQIRELLRQGRTQEALELAEALEREVQQLNEQLQEGLVEPRAGGSGGAGAPIPPELRRAARDLDAIAREQERLIKDTARLEERERRQLERHFKKGFEKELREVQKKVAGVRRRMGRIDAAGLNPYDRKALQETRSGLARLEQRLKNRDVPRAASDARKLSEEASRLFMEMRFSARKVRGHAARRKMKRAAGTCKRAGGQLGEVADRLQSMMPDPKDALGERGMRRAKELQRRQRSVKERLGEASRRLGKGQGGKAMRGIVRGKMDGAGQMMQRASERLGSGRPERARRHEEDALERIREARKRLRDAMRPGKGGGKSGSGSTDPRQSEEPVEIPGKEAYKAPRAFRDLLMRTMKEHAPGRLGKALQQYFRELAR